MYLSFSLCTSNDKLATSSFSMMTCTSWMIIRASVISGMRNVVYSPLYEEYFKYNVFWNSYRDTIKAFFPDRMYWPAGRGLNAKFTPVNLGQCLHKGKVYRMKIHIVSENYIYIYIKNEVLTALLWHLSFSRFQYEIVYEFLILLGYYKKRYPLFHYGREPFEWPLMI